MTYIDDGHIQADIIFIGNVHYDRGSPHYGHKMEYTSFAEV
jgi:hypothetical protein